MNEPDLQAQLAEFRADRPMRALLDAPSHPTLRLVSFLYVIAGLSHLWLADAWQWSWLPGNTLFLMGLITLLWRPNALGWLLCALGKALPLLFARDHLTQSLILLLIASYGVLFIAAHAYLQVGAQKMRQFATPMGPLTAPMAAFFDAIRWLIIITYLAAAFHKLNSDFFHPDRSCALYGLEGLVEHFGLTLPASCAAWTTSLAIAVIAVEASIALLYLVRRHRLAIFLAILFHLPLTLTVAPAFALVMLAGHAAFLTPDDIDAATRWIRARWIPLILTTLGATTALLIAGDLPFGDWTMVPRIALMIAMAIVLLAIGLWHTSPRRVCPDQATPRWPRRLVLILSLAFAVHCLSPYTGLRYQHTAAMVSNLRIDDPCWNHLLMPRSLRLHDPYIRIDRAYFVEPGHLERYEDKATSQLWNGPMLHQMRKNWCPDSLRPFYIEGTFKGRHFQIDDLCADDLLWPFDDAGVFGVEIFKDHLRFQRNLDRRCDQRCIH